MTTLSTLTAITGLAIALATCQKAGVHKDACRPSTASSTAETPTSKTEENERKHAPCPQDDADKDGTAPDVEAKLTGLIPSLKLSSTLAVDNIAMILPAAPVRHTETWDPDNQALKLSELAFRVRLTFDHQRSTCQLDWNELSLTAQVQQPSCSPQGGQ